MDVVKRSRFASKQMRAGPAPLASFEDLPSDELESPEDFTILKAYGCNFDDESSSRDLQFTTPDSLTISSQSTPRIESDFDSQFTLTPGEYQGQSTSDLRTASLSSLSKEESTLSIKQKKGSAISLTTLETTEVEYTLRKSSWTDIFKSHNQNSAKSSVTQLDLSEKTSKKKSKTDLSKKDLEVKSREKGKFLSLFKKKSNKQIISPVSPDNCILPNENLYVSECVNNLTEDNTIKINSKTSKGKENELPVENFPITENNTTKINSKTSKVKENEFPVENFPASHEIQNDLGKVNSDRCDKIPDERKINRKVINITDKTPEKEYNILSLQNEEKSVDKISKTDVIQAIVDIEKSIEESIESSESELTFESKELPVEKREDDFEAETLLSHDLSEIEDEPVIELQPTPFEVSNVVIPSRQQRLEVTTKPIDRPRSTTPINVSSLEAFIRSASPTFDSKIEKIKLSLPGEQFTGRVKSPKKSMKSWTDFCERALHSPRMYKRTGKNSHRNPFDSLGRSTVLRSTQFESADNWAAFESDFASTNKIIFGDKFDVHFDKDPAVSEQLPKNLCDPYHYFESNFNSSSCEPFSHKCSCSTNNNGVHPADMPVCPKDSKECSCPCHSEKESGGVNSESCNSVNSFGAPFGFMSDEQF